MSNPVDVLTLIAEHWTELQGHAVSGVWVFGSAARGELRPDSDIDLLVEFDRPVSLFEFARLRGHLQDLLGRPVDLVTREALKPQLRARILREAVRAA
ncbi:MAG: nucleotidyltransferase family protein [Acidobacteria bacterium]|nr:nucleotidyltransferase family protein [Acidobacteriota bacterium]